MNIAELLRAQASVRPGTAAIIDTRRGRSRSITFAGLERAAARASALLWQAGLRPGDAVLVFHPMSAELYIALIAIFRLGLMAMFLDPSAGREHIERCCAILPPKALIAGTKAHLFRLISSALRRIPHTFVIGLPVPGAVPWARAVGLTPREQIHSCTPETPALLTFTSGSSGQPKAAVRTHGFLYAQHRVLERCLALTPGMVDLTTLPIFVLANLSSGVTSLIPDADLRYPGAIDPVPVIAQLQAHRVASTAASPALLERLAQYCLRHHLTLPHVQKIFGGGAPVFPRLLSQLRGVAPHAEIVAVYGSTEAEPIAHIAHRHMQSEDIAAMHGGRGLLVGPPVQEIQVRILPNEQGIPVGPYTVPEFAAQCLPSGEAGEIVVSGEHVLSGYWEGQGDREAKFRVEEALWHRTGDAGYLDAQGRLWLLGRCVARIEDDRGTLYPFAVECALSHHHTVHRAAVVAKKGRRILAVEFSKDAGRTDLIALQETVSWAQLDEIRVPRHIPVDKRHNAKIDYPALSRLLDRS